MLHPCPPPLLSRSLSHCPPSPPPPFPPPQEWAARARSAPPGGGGGGAPSPPHQARARVAALHHGSSRPRVRRQGEPPRLLLCFAAFFLPFMAAVAPDYDAKASPAAPPHPCCCPSSHPFVLPALRAGCQRQHPHLAACPAPPRSATHLAVAPHPASHAPPTPHPASHAPPTPHPTLTPSHPHPHTLTLTPSHIPSTGAPLHLRGAPVRQYVLCLHLVRHCSAGGDDGGGAGGEARHAVQLWVG